MPFELFIGLRYLKAKRKSTFISIITFISTAGVALGVMALIVVLAVMTGFEEDLKEKILGTNAHMVVIRSGAPMEDYRSVMEKLKGFKGVQAATPFIYNQVMLSSGKNVSGVVLRGIDVATDRQVTRLSKSVVEGSIDGLEPKMGQGADAMPGLLVGKELAKHLNLFLGDKVNVISPMGNITPLGMMPQMKPFRVAGIFNTGMFEYDSTLAYVSLGQAQRFFDLGDTVTGIQLKVEDVYHTGELARSINREMGADFYARDWMQMNRNILFALKTEKIVMFIILTLIVLVAAFGIASTLFMVVMEKTRDIAILKSMGATGSQHHEDFCAGGVDYRGHRHALGRCFGSADRTQSGADHRRYPEDHRTEFLQQGYLLSGPFPFAGGAVRCGADFGNSGADLVSGHALSGLAGIANAAGRGAAL